MKGLRLTFSLTLLITAVLGCYFVYTFNQAFTDPGNLETSKIIMIPSGSGLKQISETLEKERIIKDAFVFLWSARLRRKGRTLKAGEYEFKAHISPTEVMDLLVSGKTYQYKFTAAEGLTTEEIIKEINAFEPLSGTVNVIPEEGRLLPETYLFARGYKRQELVNRMSQKLTEILDSLWNSRPSNFPLKTKLETLVMASIVEKETALPEERPLIAAVFMNRLRRGMPLQSDPTIAYILYKEQGRPLNQGLSHKDLKLISPYNTYLTKGLPPKPICNPGKASLQAVFKPENSEVLYFVANGMGGHVFSKSLEEHQKNHSKWRKIRKELKQAQIASDQLTPPTSPAKGNNGFIKKQPSS